jgi:zinc and cadmium transporter
MVAIAALSIHSFFDGVAIGAAVDGTGDSLAVAVFLSVLIHKPMDGLSVSVLLLNARTSRGTLWLVQLVYAALVPIGAAAFMATRGAIADPSPMVGYTLAFSAGTFLAIALTDLLPELHFHTHDRHKLSAALLVGLGIMWVTSLFGHAHEHVDDAEPHEHSEQPLERHDGHDHAHD